MRTWVYNEPTENGDREVKVTDAEILASYFTYWSEQMKKVGKFDQINEENCITDFVVVHWAYRDDNGKQT